MFTIQDRERIRAALVAAARADARIAAAATLGSAALGHTDGLSDIDLALGWRRCSASWQPLVRAAEDPVAPSRAAVSAISVPREQFATNRPQSDSFGRTGGEPVLDETGRESPGGWRTTSTLDDQ